jgi:phosphoribosyl 1,2-cyclic phosphate phosphodiesterase
MQCLAHNIRRVDAVFYTHGHADHVSGLDDLRRFSHLQGSPLLCLGNEHTLGVVQRMFPYAFNHDPTYPSAKPRLVAQVLDGPIELFGTRIIPIPLFHGQLPVLGYRVGDFAYCTDVNRIPDESRVLLQGLKVLVLDALRHRPHPTHFNLAQAVETAGQIAAEHTYFTHIAHELGHTATNAILPAGLSMAYDGLVIELPGVQM